MTVLDWVTLVTAVIGAGLGIWNTFDAHVRTQVRFRIDCVVNQPKNRTPTVTIKVVNTGQVPIAIEQVFLTGPHEAQFGRYRVWPERGKGRVGIELAPNRNWATTFPAEAIHKPLMRDCFVVVAKAEDGTKVELVSTALRKLAAQMRAAAKERVP